MESQQHVVIVGGGFAGIRTALDLASLRSLRITLVTNNPFFEYYPGLHKILGISEHATYRIALEKIFNKTSVHVCIDTVTAIDAHTKTITTSSNQIISADYVVLALGSQTEYFNISGLEQTAFGFKSVEDAFRLKRHIQELFSKHHSADKAETVVALHMVIVGAGPNGVDLAGELACFTKKLAQEHGIVDSFVTIDLIEGASRVLPMMPERVSRRVTDRLEKLGVNVLCNRDLKKNESWTVTLADMTLGARTLVWTAGITTNDLVTKIQGLELGKRNRIIVDEYLQAKGFENIFCVGDNADTMYSGLAQTALHNGSYVADVISRKHFGKSFHSYVPKPVAYNIGVGPRWSVLVLGKFISFGLFPYVMRTVIDIKFFLSILSAKEVWNLYFKKNK